MVPVVDGGDQAKSLGEAVQRIISRLNVELEDEAVQISEGRGGELWMPTHRVFAFGKVVESVTNPVKGMQEGLWQKMALYRTFDELVFAWIFYLKTLLKTLTGWVISKKHESAPFDQCCRVLGYAKSVHGIE